MLREEFPGTMGRSQRIALTAVFATLSVVCDSVAGLPQFTEGVWYGWIFILAPITGIVVGPLEGFFATLIGVALGHMVYPRGSFEYLFTIGAPLGSMISALISRRQWKPVILYYSLLFIAYFSSPVAPQLPLWGMWDTYVAYFAILLLIIFWKTETHLTIRGRTLHLLLSAVIGLEADVLFRIFLFIPCQTYASLFHFSVEYVHEIWALGALVTPIQVGLSSLVTLAVTPSLLNAISSSHWFIPEKR